MNPIILPASHSLHCLGEQRKDVVKKFDHCISSAHSLNKYLIRTWSERSYVLSPRISPTPPHPRCFLFSLQSGGASLIKRLFFVFVSVLFCFFQLMHLKDLKVCSLQGKIKTKQNTEVRHYMAIYYMISPRPHSKLVSLEIIFSFVE